MNETRGRYTSWFLVLMQVLLLCALIFIDFHSRFDFMRFTQIGIFFEIAGMAGILVSALGLGKALTIMPIPKTGVAMSTGGLYRFVRHPMYASVLLFSLGVALQTGHLFKYLIVALLALLLYFKSSYEEKYLVQKYSDYASYAERTPRFIPLTRRRRG